MNVPDLPGPPSVLVAEDDPTLLELIPIVLQEVGFAVRPVSDGAAALRLFHERPDEVDLAVLDIMMPGMDGIAVRAELRKTRSRLPVLLMSGVVPQLPPGDPLIDAFLVKPFRNHVLQHTALELLGAAAFTPSGRGAGVVRRPSARFEVRFDREETGDDPPFRAGD